MKISSDPNGFGAFRLRSRSSTNGEGRGTVVLGVGINVVGALKLLDVVLDIDGRDVGETSALEYLES